MNVCQRIPAATPISWCLFVQLFILWTTSTIGPTTGSARAQDLSSPTKKLPLWTKEQAAFRLAAERAAECVVQIETFGGLERVGEQRVAEGPTTGTVIDAEGWIVSSLFSLRQQPASILVTLPDGQRVPARIVARDFSRELAILKVETPTKLSTARPGPASASQQWVGSWAVALGKTYDANNVSQSIGIISAVDRAYGRAIQTDAKISPLNYGGPLVDLHGSTLGVLTPISPGTFIDGDSSQLYDSGIGFAIPLPDILQRLPRLQAGEDIHPGKLGIVAAEQNELAGPLRIAGAIPGSPAAKAGVRPGDFLIEANGKPIQLLAQFRHAIGPSDAGNPFAFTVLRGDQRIEMSGELLAELPTYRRRYLGLRLKETDKPGLEIVDVIANSPAGQSKLESGQRIIACNGQPLDSDLEFRKQIAVAELDRPLRLNVQGPEDSTSTVEILATTWPTELATDIPAADDRLEESMQPQVVDINLGDFPNQAYALIPPLADQRSLGLLVVFPEPGNLDREKTKAHWNSFARKFGWIVAVVNSGDTRRWTSEEIQLAGRVVGRMEKGYKLNPAKIVYAGLGIGGRIALAAAVSKPEKVQGIITLGTSLERFRPKQENFPLKSLDFLFVGNPDLLKATAEALTEKGFAANLIPSQGIQGNKWDSLPQSQMEFWLEGIARF